jgi:hypothetical protein
LASVDLISAINKLTDNELDDLFIKGPKFIQTWDVMEVLENLLNSNADQGAIRVAQVFRKRIRIMYGLILQHQVYKKRTIGRSVNYWQTLSILYPHSSEKSITWKSYLKTEINRKLLW